MKNRAVSLSAGLAASLLLVLVAFSAQAGGAEERLRTAETAFAQTMADRDHAAFVAFLDDETIFFHGEQELRGKQAVADAWKPFFDGPRAPFSWMPESVAVLDSGKLGLSSGPVLGADGKRVGTFNSVWRRTKDGGWKIVFDRGCPPCESGR
ncbi:MAG: nuclear transport factor 2 family protein [bacterium]|nr:nuclear transport factor 2 family protein [bacterium]